jgi:2-hydroxychromene-2-carboxylate isomerase
MDCRRQARKRGLVILGTRKIWDSSLAAIGMLWAKRHGKRQFRAYHDRVFERFWRRELDVEDPEAIAAVLSEVDADTTGFRSFLTGAAGRIEHDAIRESAEAAGVFGVPSFIVDGELFGDVSTWPIFGRNWHRWLAAIDSIRHRRLPRLGAG